MLNADMFNYRLKSISVIKYSASCDIRVPNVGSNRLLISIAHNNGTVLLLYASLLRTKLHYVQQLYAPCAIVRMYLGL